MQEETDFEKQLLKISKTITKQQWSILCTNYLKISERERSSLAAKFPNEVMLAGLIEWHQRNPNVSLDSLKSEIYQAKHGNLFTKIRNIKFKRINSVMH